MTLNQLKDDLAKNIYGIRREEAISKGICIDCKEPVKWYSEAGEKEYRISGLCEECFDKLFKEYQDDI